MQTKTNDWTGISFVEYEMQFQLRWTYRGAPNAKDTKRSGPFAVSKTTMP